MKTIKLFIYLSCMLVVMAATSCKHAEVEAPKSDKFCLSDTIAKDLQLATIKKEIVHNELVLSGKVAANADKSVKVFPMVGGSVEQLKVQIGDYVQKGQVLAVIRSSEIADYDNQLISAKANLAVATKSASAADDMYKSGLMSEREYISAKNDLDKAKGDMNRIQETMKIYGSGANSLYNLVAPVSGFVIEKNVTDGMHFRADGVGNFFTISNLDEIWVLANVFESDISKIKEGYDAKVKLMAFPDKDYVGKIDRIFSILDSASRVMKVRIRIPNKDFSIKPEMFAQVHINYEDNKTEMLAVPSKAIVFNSNVNFLMVYHDNCNITAERVTIGSTVGDTTYIADGVKEGEKVMTKYQQLVFEAVNAN